MPSRDLVHSITLKPSILAGAAVTTITNNGAGVNSLDTQGYESITVVLRGQTVTAGTLRLYIQDSADGTTWGATGTADPPTNVLVASTTNVNQIIGGAYPVGITAAGSIILGVSDCQRYVRAVANQVGYSGIFSADVILGHPKHRSVAV